MSTSTKIRKISVEIPKVTPKLSKSLIAFFAMSQLCFGFNFGFVKLTNNKFKTAIKIITPIMGCVMILTLSVSFTAEGVGQIWMIVYIIQYIPTFLLLMSANYSLCEFISDITAINNLSKLKQCNKLGMTSWIYTCSIFIIKITAAVLYCWNLRTCTNIHKLTIAFFMHIPLLAQDIVPVVHYIFFYYIFDSMRQLRNELENQKISLDILLTRYKAITNAIDKFRSTHDAVFIWGFVTESPKWMSIIWNHVALIKATNSWIAHACSYAWTLHVTVEICVPAIFAELISVQTDAMKMFLHERLLIEKDPSKITELNLVLRYIKARTILQKAWRLLPLDLRLPITMLSMCTTYLIVIVQFSHIFD